MFGSHRRRDRRCECDTCIPKKGVFPHTSQTAAIAQAWYQPYLRLLRNRTGRPTANAPAAIATTIAIHMLSRPPDAGSAASDGLGVGEGEAGGEDVSPGVGEGVAAVPIT
jgi:hypothetical protein